MSNRLQSIEEQLRQTISFALEFEMRDPHLEGITFTGVRLSPDFQFADIRYSCLNDEDQHRSQEALVRAEGALKKYITQRVRMRRIPKLRFHFDELLAKERRIGEILEQLNLTNQDEGPDETHEPS